MSKAERLFALVNLLRGRRVAVTASELSRQLGVSERTIYRDIAALLASGVPIEGEAGVGYRLSSSSHLPPLMFEHKEAAAIALGLKLVRAMTDPGLGIAAQRAEARLRAVLPDGLKIELEQLPYRVPVLERDASLRARHALVREAASACLKLEIRYSDESGRTSSRLVWPLALMAFGNRWTVLAWCESREDYRNFRLDRIEECRATDERFRTTKTLNIGHYYQTRLGIDDIV